MHQHIRIGAATLAAWVGVSQAQVISWNWDRFGTVRGDRVAGVVPASNWNNSWPAYGTQDLIDDSGVPTSMDIAWASFNDWTVNEPAPANPGQDADGSYNRELLNGYLNAGEAAWEPPITYTEVTISDVPFGSY
ncbi:MAG: hypothetical protein KDA28_01225, partial [Phycisphaerales bacterium]|nr:hypothetical protein [Phycisphaerales bacterium]